MANLYEINKEIDDLLQSNFTQDESIVNLETGEITSLADKLDELELDQRTKFDNLGCYIKNLTSDIDAIKNEEKSLADRRRVKENQLERLKQYLSDNLQYAGYDKFESPRCVLSFRKSSKIEIDENVNLPSEYLNVKEIVEPNKKLLTDAIKNGIIVDGVRLVENKNLQIK